MGGVGWGVMGVEGSGKGSRMVLIVARVGPVGGMVAVGCQLGSFRGRGGLHHDGAGAIYKWMTFRPQFSYQHLHR